MQKAVIFLYLSLFLVLGFLLGLFSIHYTGHQTFVGNFTVNVVSTVSCTVSTDGMNVSFGSNLEDGEVYNATKNYNYRTVGTSYNITNDQTSTTTMNVSIKGIDFISDSLVLKIGNLSWASNDTSPNGTNLLFPGMANLSTSYSSLNLASDLSAGSTAWYRFWIRIPDNQPGGSYQGNYTLLCQANNP
ncbi:hypothetical protein HZB00_02420 [Candidatus Woesearchaeota archaeon]|nr:hypothetical protein [Candidatus Woesearchaeota archaeon]